MANAHIDVTGTASRLSAKMRRTVDALLDVQSDFEEINDVMIQVAYEADYEALGTYLGIGATEAQEIYNLWASANAEIRGTFLTAVRARLG